MRFTFLQFLVLMIFSVSVWSQNKLSVNSQGEIPKKNYEELIQKRGYQAISSFDTVSINPLLIYAIYIKDNKRGILDYNGKEITPAIYENISGLQLHPIFGTNRFHDFYIVEQNDKYGVISNTGKQLIPNEYYYIEYGSNSHETFVKDTYFIIEIENGEKYFDTKGREIQKPKDESEVNYNQENIAPKSGKKEISNDNPFGNVTKRIRDFAIVQKQIDGKYKSGAVDLEKQKLIVPVQYDFVNFDRFQRLIAGNYILEKNYTLYDTVGKELFSGYENIEEVNGAYFLQKENKTAVFDEDLKQVTDFIYERGFHYKGRILTKKDGKYGMIDLKGKEILPFEYDIMNFIYYQVGSSQDLNPYVKATKNGKDGIFDFSGKILIPVDYDKIDTQISARDKNPSYYGGEIAPLENTITEDNQYFVVQKDRKYGLIGNDFKEILPNQYDEILKGYNDNFLHVYMRDENNKRKQGLFDVKRGKFLFEPEADIDLDFKEGKYIIYKKGNEYAMYDLNGKQIIPFQSREINGINEIYKGLKYVYSYGKTKAELYLDIYKEDFQFYGIIDTKSIH